MFILGFIIKHEDEEGVTLEFDDGYTQYMTIEEFESFVKNIAES